MTQFSELVSTTNYELRGIDDDAPTSGTDEYNYWLSTANRLVRSLYRKVGKKWRMGYKATAPTEPGTVATAGTTALTGTSTKFTDYNAGDTIVVSGETVRTIAAITSDTALTVTVAFDNTDSALTFTKQTIIATGVQSYSLHRSFLGASNQAIVTKTDGTKVYFDIVKPEEASITSQETSMSGNLPELITFSVDIASTDMIVGGTLDVPGYYMPANMTGDTSDVEVPDEDWLALNLASEIAFNDITYEDKAPDLLAKANSSYRHMAQNNRRGTYNQPKQTPINMRKIGRR